jgi:hypothetical protein
MHAAHIKPHARALIAERLGRCSRFVLNIDQQEQPKSE